MSVSEELARLAELRDKGVLSEQEFQAQKAEVLAGRPAPASQAEPEKKKPGVMKIGCLSVIAIIVVVVIIGMIAGPKPPSGQPASDSGKPADPPMKVTAEELFKAYDDNEAAAQQKYGSRPLLVSGSVSKIDLDIVDNPVVMLRTSNEFMPAQAALADESKAKAPSLSKGEAVDLLCDDVSEVIGTPMLKNCVLQ